MCTLLIRQVFELKIQLSLLHHISPSYLQQILGCVDLWNHVIHLTGQRRRVLNSDLSETWMRFTILTQRERTLIWS